MIGMVLSEHESKEVADAEKVLAKVKGCLKGFFRGICPVKESKVITDEANVQETR